MSAAQISTEVTVDCFIETGRQNVILISWIVHCWCLYGNKKRNWNFEINA